ncbi:hypothetical protein F2Q69_00016159 [Brassica cretica]|uniref:WAT1-related protein n=1 Tax=Brassica cretica TaxID=69181 RepID=A0A8S9QTE1_BRACR|nr:hypothetical protein F2Q69_00016159 [Brassica cretica]
MLRISVVRNMNLFFTCIYVKMIDLSQISSLLQDFLTCASRIPHTSFYLHPSRYLQATPHSLSFCDKLGWISDIKSVMRGTGEDTVAWRYFHRDVVPFAAMFAVECSTVGSNTLYKAASLRGLNSYVFIFYSYAASTIVLLPLVLIFGRSKKLPSAKSPLFFKMFLLGIFGCMARMVGFKGVEQSSPTLSSAMSNLTPAFTFTLAVIFRMEQVVLRSSATQAKIIGGVLSISGALVVVLYKGPKVLSAASFTPSSSPTSLLHQQLTSSESSWIVGGILLASQYFLLSAWYIVQGVFASLFNEITHTWGLHLKGPVYVSVFRPLSIAIAVVMGVIFLSDALHLGRTVEIMSQMYCPDIAEDRQDSDHRLFDPED